RTDFGGEEYNAGGTNERIAYDATLEYLRKSRKPKTQDVVIVMSDGAPNAERDETNVVMNIDGDEVIVPVDHNTSGHSALRKFWERQSDVSVYGIGIISDASQIPSSKRINTISELPNVM